MAAYPDAKTMLRHLRAGPYAGRGGAWAMARDLGVPLNTVYSWSRAGQGPCYANMVRLRRLWEAHGLDQEPPTPEEG